MTTFLLDTNVISEFWKKEKAARPVLDWLRRARDEDMFVSVVTLGELRYGIDLAPSGSKRRYLEERIEELKERFRDRIVSIDARVAERWAHLRASQQLRGRSVGLLDGLIAASAIEARMAIASRNVRDFEDLGVRVVNPFEVS